MTDVFLALDANRNVAVFSSRSAAETFKTSEASVVRASLDLSHADDPRTPVITSDIRSRVADESSRDADLFAVILIGSRRRILHADAYTTHDAAIDAALHALALNTKNRVAYIVNALDLR